MSETKILSDVCSIPTSSVVYLEVADVYTPLSSADSKSSIPQQRGRLRSVKSIELWLFMASFIATCLKNEK